jgi:hypothetical protein
MSDYDVTHEERRLNAECGQAIEKAISETYKPGSMAGTGYYDNKIAVQTVIDEYGSDRVAAVLAANINSHGNDGRITRTNKEWAKNIGAPDNPNYYLNTHLTILNGFADKLREAIQQEHERNNQSAEKYNSAVTITSDTRHYNGWVKGIANGNITFEAKVFDKPSQFGIENGRVSKLSVRDGDKWIINFDRGWDVKPSTPGHEAVYGQIIQRYKIYDFGKRKRGYSSRKTKRRYTEAH